MRVKVLIIITVMFFLNSCSESTNPENEDFSVKDIIKFKDVSGKRLLKTDDNCLAIGADKTNPGIIKCDLNGNVIWEKYYSIGSEASYIDYFCETSDGGFILTGWGYINPRSFIIRTDSEGNLLWMKDSLDNAGYFRKAIENNNGEVILVTTGSQSADITKFDQSGNEVWRGNYNYNVDGIYLPILAFHDFAISPDNDIYLIYNSSLSGLKTLVKIIVGDNGVFKSGKYYDIYSYNGCIFFKGDTHFIFGGYFPLDDDRYSFLYSFYSYGPSTVESYDILNFNGFNSISLTDDGSLISTDDYCVVKLNENLNYDWMYEVDWTTTEDRFNSSVEFDNNVLILLGNTEWTENDSTVQGAFLRHLTKN